MLNYQNYSAVMAKHVVVAEVGQREIPTLPLGAETETAAQLGLRRSDLHRAALEAGIVPRRYLRNIGTIGVEGQLKLFDSKVAVIGCGGLGGLVVELLARMGVGTLVLVDNDVFEDSNLNRQLLCTEADMGKPKVMAAYERVRAVNSAVEVCCFQQRLTAKNALAILRGVDLVIDALDNLPSRFVLEQAAFELNIPMVHGAIAGFLGQVTTIYPGEAGLRQIYGEPGQRERGIEVETGNPATTPALIATLQVQEAVKYLTGVGEPQRQRLLYVDGLSGEISQLKLTSDREHAPAVFPICFVGTSNSGKTGFMVKLISELVSRGLNVAAVKHGHTAESLDKEGTDSWRYRLAGAHSTAFLSSDQAALFYQITDKEAASRLKHWFPEADIILMEGYKSSPFPKILVYRDGVSEILSPWPKNIIALAGDITAAQKIGWPKNIPGFSWDETGPLADFVLKRYK